MTYGYFSLRRVLCAGPGKTIAQLDFSDGANAIIGLSNTGKSLALELVDYMFGGEELKRLMYIPELEGYDTALLTLSHSNGSLFTLRRSLSGGDIHVLDGLVGDRTGGIVLETIVRNDRKSGKPRSFSQFFLNKLGISGKILRRNQNETQNLTFRPLIRLAIVDEERIISTGSPALSSGQYIASTPEKSLFKFLLSGTDDSALVLYSEQTRTAQQKTDQAIAAQKLLSQRRQQLEDQGHDEIALRQELAQVDAALADVQEISKDAEGSVTALRRRLRRLSELKDLTDFRIKELEGLLQRFSLLDQHYLSDIGRLSAISEAAQNLKSLAPGPCPLCGAPPEAHQSVGCAGDLDALAQAANAEVDRIHRLRTDLEPTITKARVERLELTNRREEADLQMAIVNRDLTPALETVRRQRAGYTHILQQWAVVKESLRAFDAVRDFELSAAVLKREAEGMVPVAPEVAISRASTDGFAREVAAILSAWNVPQTERVAFDHQQYDLQLNSRLRGAQGKGLRALTHAAFSIALMTYCIKNEKPHPGFVIVDSPLLSYRGDVEDEDPTQSLKATTVDEAFYRWLAKDLSYGQVIVIENRDTPSDARNNIHLHEFLRDGRTGFIPV